MKETIPIINASMELAECQKEWTFDEAYQCWCLEDVLYTEKANVPKFQRLSIFVPEAYLKKDGTPNLCGQAHGYTGANVPIVFENNAAGYMQMPHTWLGGPRSYAKQYLDAGFVYISCGCRGRESRDAAGTLVGKAPISLIDLKTAIRFLRHNRKALPGDWNRIVSVGWSAGGAMSALLAVTGDHPAYDAYLRENGAFCEESDAVYAAQIYCPIIDLEHADMAYEWMFQADKTCEDSPAGPAETMTPFKQALSRQLAKQYVSYFNSLALKDPKTGAPLTLAEDGRSGSAYAYLMQQLSYSATDFLTRLQNHALALNYTAEQYLAGDYTFETPAAMPPPPGGGPGLHHAGPGVALAGFPMGENRPMTPPSLGDLVSRPPKGIPYHGFEPPMETRQGDAKQSWLHWDGKQARIKDLDAYVLGHRRRMKPCTAFDKLTMDSGENQAFGSAQADYLHFSESVAQAVESLKTQFPEECAQYQESFSAVARQEEQKQQIALINPMRFIEEKEVAHQAQHYRIRVGASDADTAFTISMALALKLANAGCGTVDYALVWDQPHSEADYPGEVCEWIRQLQ